MAEKSKNWVDSLGEIFAKLPSLPAGIREFIVTIAPWLALIFGILGVLGSLSALGLSTVSSPLLALGGVKVAGGLMLISILTLAQSVLILVAVPKLFPRKMAGWTFVFWSQIVGVVSAVVSMEVGGVIFSLIGFYILYQVRSYYK